MSSNTSERDLAEHTKKVGLLQRDRPGKEGNAFTWYISMESVLRSRSLYYVVDSADEREKAKRTLLDVIAGEDGPKKAQIKLDKLRHEDQS